MTEMFSRLSTASKSDYKSDTELDIAVLPPIPEVKEETVYFVKNKYT